MTLDVTERGGLGPSSSWDQAADLVTQEEVLSGSSSEGSCVTFHLVHPCLPTLEGSHALVTCCCAAEYC